MSGERCKAQLPWGNFGRTRQCRKLATMDGWCSTHHPQEKADRIAKRLAEERKQYEKRTAEYARQAAIPRKARELALHYVNAADSYSLADQHNCPDCLRAAREILSLLGEDAK